MTDFPDRVQTESKSQKNYKKRTKGCNSNKSAKQLHEQFKTILSAFEIQESETELIKIGITNMYSAFFEEANENQKLYKSKISELKKKIESAEENLVTGVIDRKMFEKFTSKFNAEIVELETQLAKFRKGSSNLEKSLNIVVKFCRKPLLWWENAKVGEKMILQNLIFPSGIIYERKNDRVLTKRINSFFAPIPELVGALRGNKKGTNKLFYSSVPSGDPGRIQTCNPQSRNLMRYSVAPRGHF